MKIAVPDIRPVSQVGRNFGAVTAEVEEGRSILVVKNNRPVAAVVPPETIERLDEIAEREEDIALLVLSIIRMNTHQGIIHDLDDVAAELGIDIAELRVEVAEEEADE